MKKIIVISTILAVLIFITYFKVRDDKPGDPRGNAYAGSASCFKCHKAIYNSYLHTAHYLASAPATLNTVHGSFAKNLNSFNVNASQQIVMEKVDSSMFQTWYLNGKFKERHHFDVVLGGVKGESYLYWNGNGLYQLPVSYYTKQHKWLMSPKFAPGYVDFSRIITSRCMECHASYIGDQAAEEQRLNAAEQFDKSTLVYSIDCERCHGPGAQHIDFQKNNPDVKTARFITSYASLSRERKVDMCAVCHSGNKSQMIRSTFFFMPGDTDDKFKLPEFYRTASDTSNLDVHGNQVQLLKSSKCFIKSNMDCATCHDTHKNQRGNTALFIQKCLGCHNTVNHNYCKMANLSNTQFIKSNCIQCHMPNILTKAIVSPAVSKISSVDIMVHTHHIAIYPREIKKVITAMVK